ncbi:extracellular solute-binding protein [Paracoccus methylarcula]|uniref:Carbohydrate ABC transporter substrate-binding protein n=1 Tax=Paracoccus methylarcula TaxID=72022 RepID=A0A422QVA0_9RHOB|nr:ABC transporter substrate-binding protein [Paracoccus methylarcula]RNF33889.1 carbohydrate ABC transporter substrate-binding protein [Paracoccus methylarcula]
MTITMRPRVLWLALAGAALAGHAGAQELDYWVYSDFAQGEALELQQSFIDEFKAEHPEVEITISGRGDDDLLTGQIAGAASGTGPDVFMNSTSLGAILVEAGALKNIYEDWMAMPEEFRKQFNPDLIDMCSPEPEVMYCLPYTGYGSFMYRNLAVLKEAGIDPDAPIRDWEDWKAQMEKIEAIGKKAVPDMSQTWFSVANAYSGVAEPGEWGIDFENDKTLIEPDKLAAAAQLLVDMKPYSTGTSEDDQATKDLFMSNELAFIVGGPWINPIFEQAAENGDLEYDWVLVPGAEEGKHGGVKGFEFIGVAPKENAGISWLFAAYVAEKSQMSRWAAALGRYNSNDEALADPEVSGHPLLKITNDAAKNAIFNRPPFFVEAYPADYWSVLLDGIASIVEGDETPDEGAARIVEELDEVIAYN